MNRYLFEYEIKQKDSEIRLEDFVKNFLQYVPLKNINTFAVHTFDKKGKEYIHTLEGDLAPLQLIQGARGNILKGFIKVT